jgi:hypothetical protein
MPPWSVESQMRQGQTPLRPVVVAWRHERTIRPALAGRLVAWRDGATWARSPFAQVAVTWRRSRGSWPGSTVADGGTALASPRGVLSFRRRLGPDRLSGSGKALMRRARSIPVVCRAVSV